MVVSLSLPCSFFLLTCFTVNNLPKSVLDRFEAYETEKNANREELKELTQRLDRLQSESASSRTWITDRLLRLWENVSARDDAVMDAMRTVHRVLLEEGERHERLTKAVEKVEAVIASPPLLTAIMPLPVTVPESQEESGDTELVTSPVTSPVPTQSPPPSPKQHLKRTAEADGPAPKRQKV